MRNSTCSKDPLATNPKTPTKGYLSKPVPRRPNQIGGCLQKWCDSPHFTQGEPHKFGFFRLIRGQHSPRGAPRRRDVFLHGPAQQHLPRRAPQALSHLLRRGSFHHDACERRRCPRMGKKGKARGNVGFDPRKQQAKPFLLCARGKNTKTRLVTTGYWKPRRFPGVKWSVWTIEINACFWRGALGRQTKRERLPEGLPTTMSTTFHKRLRQVDGFGLASPTNPCSRRASDKGTRSWLYLEKSGPFQRMPSSVSLPSMSVWGGVLLSIKRPRNVICGLFLFKAHLKGRHFAEYCSWSHQGDNKIRGLPQCDEMTGSRKRLMSQGPVEESGYCPFGL